MEKTAEKIRGYFNNREIGFREAVHTDYSYHASFSSSARLQDCRVRLAPCGEGLRICVTLPFRVRREEASAVSEVIADLNEAMPENAGYFLDPLNGAVMLVVRDQAPEDDGQLDAMLSGVLRSAEADAEGIMDAIHTAKQHIRYREEEKAREEAEASRAGETSLLDRLLVKCGLKDPEE